VSLKDGWRMIEELRVIAENLLKPKSFCKHESWRPAITSKAVAKMCGGCAILVPISDAEFYALFGDAAMRRALSARGVKW
jgi:hypothetical protein